jgi:hypothetical protein
VEHPPQWLVDRGLLLDEAVALGKKCPDGLPFTLAEALEIEIAAARPEELDRDPHSWKPRENIEDFRICWREMVCCGGWIGDSEERVLLKRAGGEAGNAGGGQG